MRFSIQRADKRHLRDINRLVVETKIGSPMKTLEGRFWFVRVDGRIVGYVGAEMIGKDAAVLKHLAVDQQYRKRGIGMSLFRHAVAHVRARGATTIGFVTMYYHFNRFKKRGFKTRPRKLLPEKLQNHWMFTTKRYMKCAAMVQTFSS